MSHADLIARLEALTGPDREADEAIARLTGWSPTGGIPATGAPSHWYSAAFGMPAYTASLDAAVALVERVLPGWGWRVATCCVSDDAWIFPDFNHPVHGERLKREFREDIDWVEITDVDLRPSGRPAIALLIATLKALDHSNDR